MSTRYPYTEAYDFIRMQTCEHNESVGFAAPSYSRSDCARICHAIAPALNMTAEDLAKRVADFARAHPAAEPEGRALTERARFDLRALYIARQFTDDGRERAHLQSAIVDAMQEAAAIARALPQVGEKQ